MDQFDLQYDNPFFRAFTTRVPFRDGVLEDLTYKEILGLGQTCRGLLEEDVKSRYLDVISVVTGGYKWVRYMRRQGFKLLLIGPSKCDTAMKFLKYSELGKTLLFVLSKDDQRFLEDKDVLRELRPHTPNLEIFSYDGFETFMSRTILWQIEDEHRPRPRPHGLFKVPHRAAIQQETPRSVLNWRPHPGWGGDTDVFETPTKSTKHRVLHSGTLMGASHIETIEWAEYSQEDLDVIISGKSSDSKRPVLVFRPKDWDSGSDKSIVAASL